MSDWRERWEEKDTSRDKIVDVWERNGEAVAYLYIGQATGNVILCKTPEGNLIPKKKPPTYRPYKRDEVKCGQVFVANNYSKSQFMVTAILDTSVCLNGGQPTTLTELLDSYTNLDGTPAGVAE